MKPHVLLIEPMMPEVEAQLDAAYCVHPLFAAHDRAALLAAIGSSVRAIDRVGADAVDGDDLQPRQCIDDLIAGAMRAAGNPSPCSRLGPSSELTCAASPIRTTRLICHLSSAIQSTGSRSQ
jgi:hypothetical protein